MSEPSADVGAVKYVAVERPHAPIHLLVCADAFAGKSTFARTFPKPMLVTCFDALDKVEPYLAAGRVGDLYTESNGMRSRLVYAPDSDEAIIKIEHYLDWDPEKPQAWIKFRERVRKLPSEAEQWATWVIDSVTNAEFYARLESMFVINTMSNAGNEAHGKKHYGHSKEQIEINLMARVAWMPMNVVAIAHYDDAPDDMEAGKMKNPSVPGKLTKRLPAGFGEMYRLVPYVDEKGMRRPWLQTRPGDGYNAGSVIGVANGCPATYEALWNGRA